MCYRFLHEYVCFIPQIAGASSTLGQALAEEFAQSGCSVILVDNDLRSVKEIAARLRSRYRGVEEIGPDHRKRERPNAGSTMTAYQCDLLDRNAVRRFAKRVEDKIGGIDILVTCIGLPDQDIFDTVSRTLMGHYWVSVDRFVDICRKQLFRRICTYGVIYETLKIYKKKSISNCSFQLQLKSTLTSICICIYI